MEFEEMKVGSLVGLNNRTIAALGVACGGKFSNADITGVVTQVGVSYCRVQFASGRNRSLKRQQVRVIQL